MPINTAFGTDKQAESEGVWQEFDDFRIRIARQGGSNSRYYAAVAKNAKPHKRAIQTETASPEIVTAIGLRSFAEACVTGWQYKDESGAWKDGIQDTDDSGELVVLPPTVDNMVATFRKYPDLFEDMSKQSQRISMYRSMVNEEDVKN